MPALIVRGISIVIAKVKHFVRECRELGDVVPPRMFQLRRFSEAFPTLHMILHKRNADCSVPARRESLFRGMPKGSSGYGASISRPHDRRYSAHWSDHRHGLRRGGFFSCLVRESDTKLRKSSICVESFCPSGNCRGFSSRDLSFSRGVIFRHRVGMCAENMRLNFPDGARARVENCPHDLLGEVASI